VSSPERTDIGALPIFGALRPAKATLRFGAGQNGLISIIIRNNGGDAFIGISLAACLI